MNNSGKHIKTSITEFLNEDLTDNQLNAILDKISEYGIESLSNHERTLLKSYSDKNIDVKEEIKKHANKYKIAKNVLDVIPLGTEDEDLNKNVGRFIRFKKDDKHGLLAESGIIYEIVAIQKHWGHDKNGDYVPNIKGYRVAMAGNENDFGKVGPVDEIEFVNISEEDAISYNKKILKELNLE